MSAVDELAGWARKRPLVLVAFGEGESEVLCESRRWPERFTFVRRHLFFHNCQVPTACLITTQEQGTIVLYLGTATRRVAVSTGESRMTVVRVRPLSQGSLEMLRRHIGDECFFAMVATEPSQDQSVWILSSELSASIVYALAYDESNLRAIETAIAELANMRAANGIVWAQRDAVRMALAIFGLDDMAPAVNVTVHSGPTTALSFLRTELIEDNVIDKDSSDIPGLKRMPKDYTGRAVFRNGYECLEVYTANKRPLEEMLGVDLIYVNSSRGSVVMVQYKMLELEGKKAAGGDWVYRFDKQAYKEMDKMKMPEDRSSLPEVSSKSIRAGSKLHEYRLNSNPYYFKFVARQYVNRSVRSLILPLEYLTQLLRSPIARGPRNGTRLSYNSLLGNYLTESVFVGLVRSGYIGTHVDESAWLTEIISRVARGDRALVVAWQTQVERENNRP